MADSRTGGRRIAMWSGPRNISTAMMRAWENRPDTDVVDEPLYAAYLHTTGLSHPARDAVLASQSSDWREVCAALTAQVPPGRVFYQKHMTHHLTPDVGLDWLGQLEHAFLIRTPERVLRSYAKVRAEVCAEDLGFEQQVRVYEAVIDRTGKRPPVIDAADVLAAPEAALRALCTALSLDFDPAMLAWPEGPRDSDGVWAEHWYSAVWRSTGWLPDPEPSFELSPEHQRLAEECRPHYLRMQEHAIQL